MRFTNFLEENTGQFLKNAQKFYWVWIFSSCLWNPSKVPTFSAFGQRAKVWRSWFRLESSQKIEAKMTFRNGFFHGFQWKTSPLGAFFHWLANVVSLDIQNTFQRILGKMGPSGGHFFGEVIPCNYQGILLIGFLSPLWGLMTIPYQKDILEEKHTQPMWCLIDPQNIEKLEFTLPSCDRAVSKHWYPLWTPSPATGRLGLPIKTSHWDHLSTCTFFKPFSGPSYQTKASWVQTSRNSTAESVNQRYQTACLPRELKGRDLHILFIFTLALECPTSLLCQMWLTSMEAVLGASAWSSRLRIWWGMISLRHASMSSLRMYI